MHLRMSWKNTAFDWNRARAFLVTAEEGSFSGAARAMGLAQPTLGRQVAALEEELGLTFFERVGKSLELTSAGLEFLEQVRAMNEAAIQCSLIAAGQAQTIEGLVRIAAGEAMSAFLLPPIIEEVLRLHPGLQLEIVVSNASSDLRRREADIAIRHFQPQGENLIARLIKEKSEAHLYAAPSYLERIGNPRTPGQLVAQGQVIGFDETNTLREALQTLGLPFTTESFPIRSENHLVQWELAKRGVGMCVMMEEVGEREPRVVRALPASSAGLAFPTWLTTHRELRTSRRIRVVFDLLADKLGKIPANRVRGDP